MKIRTWLTAVTISTVGLAALAHTGATGVMKTRMDAMGDMADAMKRVAPMMRGQAAYDPQIVRDAADTMIGHAGARMTDLFPQGSNDKPSEALDTIWEDWDGFVALAEALRTSAEGMKRAAGNGLADPGATTGAGLAGGVDVWKISVERLARKPVNVGFTAVAQTCRSCHRKFRARDE